MVTEKEKKKDIKLFKEVSWLYDRLDKKEFDILRKWVFANCEVTREEGYETGKSETINDKKLVPLDKVIGEIRKWRRREYGRRNLFQLEKNIRKLGELAKWN